MENKEIDLIKSKIKHYFGFLFDMGFKIRDSEYSSQHFGNWKVTLESPECIIEIYSDRNEISLAFGSSDTKHRSRIGLKSMVYFLSGGKNFIGPYEGNLFWGRKKQFEKLVNLLKEHINQIVPFFGRDFKKYENDLIIAQSKYNNLVVEKSDGQ